MTDTAARQLARIEKLTKLVEQHGVDSYWSELLAVERAVAWEAMTKGMRGGKKEITCIYPDHGRTA